MFAAVKLRPGSPAVIRLDLISGNRSSWSGGWWGGQIPPRPCVRIPVCSQWGHKPGTSWDTLTLTHACRLWILHPPGPSILNVHPHMWPGRLHLDQRDNCSANWTEQQTLLLSLCHTHHSNKAGVSHFLFWPSRPQTEQVVNSQG